jgi:hypothetical protein
MNELVAYKCKKCGRITYPGHFRCLSCRGREFENISPEGAAKLLTYTEVCTLPWGIDERCRTLGIVEFENKVKAMGWLKVAKPKLGMKLSANWEPVRVVKGQEVYGLTLEPAK